MEYGHRMWGRLIGAMFVIPAAIFWKKGYFNSALKKRVLIYGTLIGCQVLVKAGFFKISYFEAYIFKQLGFAWMVYGKIWIRGSIPW